jgi:hypothetical protein
MNGFADQYPIGDAGLLTRDENYNIKLKVGTCMLSIIPAMLCVYSSIIGIRNFTGTYQNSRKRDLLPQPNNQEMPSIVVESGWSERYPQLLSDMRL